jgi:hypothetical protein
MITIGHFVANVKIKVIFVDCLNGSILLKKEIMSPNSSSFKTYFNDPYFCIIYSRAKLLVMDVRQILTPGMMPEFQEIQTMINIKQNFKMMVQPIHHSGRGPTDISGFHYSS